MICGADAKTLRRTTRLLGGREDDDFFSGTNRVMNIIRMRGRSTRLASKRCTMPKESAKLLLGQSRRTRKQSSVGEKLTHKACRQSWRCKAFLRIIKVHFIE